MYVIHTYTRHLMLPTIEIIKLFVKKMLKKVVLIKRCKKGFCCTFDGSAATEAEYKEACGYVFFL